MSSQHSPTRRQAIQTIVAACCCSGGAVNAVEHPRQVDQITDPSASAATGMFRFEPDLVILDPGESIAFLNSRGEHTVHSIPQFWPEDREPVAIHNSPRVEVQFNTPGLYAFRCQRHGQYGMLMLVAVGDVSPEEDLEPRIEAMRARLREKTAFRDLAERWRKTVA